MSRTKNEHPKTNKHNYLKIIENMYANGAFKPGVLSNVEAQHDDWCDIYKGGFCNCNPDIITKKDHGG